MCDICHSSYECHPRCPNATESKLMGNCKQCGYELREAYEYYRDNEKNEFCSEECALEYHGIEAKEWD